MCNFRIGEKVVCMHSFNITDEEIELGVKSPLAKNIYTIRDIINIENSHYIRLLEIKNPVLEYVDGIAEICFNLKKFRKLDWQFGHDICDELSRQYNEEFIEL